MRRERRHEEERPIQEISCWFCGNRCTSRQVLRDGILRSREDASGGPYRLLVCPSCTRENLCEKTPRGRWFASPNYKLSLLDYLFSQILDREGTGATHLLAAISWFRDNEDRRRYFFEKDGDHRYSGVNFLRRIWPGAPAEPRRSAGSQQDQGQRRRTSDTPPRGSDRGAERESPTRRSGVVSPYEILGVRVDASGQEIRAAFQRLAIHYHPDKVHHRGQEFERVAQEKFLQLKEAYEVLLRLRDSAPGE